MRHGGIGYALSMVVFPTEKAGRDALIARLKSPEFRILTIEEFPSIWDKEMANKGRGCYSGCIWDYWDWYYLDRQARIFSFLMNRKMDNPAMILVA